MNNSQERKAEVLIGIGLSWLCITKKKNIWTHDLLEIMGHFNHQEKIGYKGFMIFPVRTLEINLKNTSYWEEKK